MHSKTTSAALAATFAIAAAAPAAWAQPAREYGATAAGAAPAATAAAAASTSVGGRRAPGSAGASAGPGTATVGNMSQLRPCTSVTVDPPTYLTLGKSRVMKLDFPVVRMVVGGEATSRAGRPVGAGAGTPGAAPAPAGGPGPRGSAADGVADTEITLLSPTEAFFLGRKTGSMNVVLQAADGRCVVKDLVVTVDPGTLQAQLGDLVPEERNVRVRAAENTIVLTGSVSDTVKLEQVLALAGSYGDGKKVVNMLRVDSPQQVMLEVQIAEVSKNLLDKLGASVNASETRSSGRNIFSFASSFLSGGAGVLQALRLGRGDITLDAQKNDGIVRILAEPNIMAISGQTASFLSGGRIFIPTAVDNANGVPRIELTEKEFGVGLKFTPIVLDGRVQLKVVSEVSELSQSGTPFTTISGITAILPSMTTRKVDTTVQLGDGQSFMVAGLIKNNVTEAVNKFPGLGEAPVLGALFRSTEFQNDQTELMFVVTPRLVKPLAAQPVLPTDNHSVPNRGEVMLNGAVEGPPRADPVPRPQP